MKEDRGVVSLPEPERDARLGRAIRAAEGPPPGLARLELLRTRIAAAAVAALEGRRAGERAWWEWMSRWVRTEVALAVAATILAGVVGGAATIGRGEVGSDTVMTATSQSHQVSTMTRLDSVVARSLATGGSSDQVMNALVGPANGEWLLTAAVAR